MSSLLDTLLTSADSTQPALTEVGKSTYTYRDLYQYSFQLMEYFSDQKISKGQRVTLLFEVGFQAVSCVLALLQLGVCVVLIDPETGEELFESKLKVAQTDFILIDSRLVFLSHHPLLRWAAKKWRPGLPFISHLDSYQLIVNTSLPKYDSTKILTPRKNTVKDDEEAIIIFTSGTTSKPKGVIHTHGTLAHSLNLLGTLNPKKTAEKFYTTQAYFLLFGLSLQAHVIFNSKPFSAEQFIKDCDEYQPTMTFGPPGEFIPIIEYCKQHHLPFPESFKNVFFGSAPITTSFLRKFYSIAAQSVETLCIYGMTEILPVAFVRGKEKVKSEVDGDLLGQLFPTVKARLAEDSELILAGQHLCKKYIGQPGHSEVRTGDIVKIKKGQVILSGRKKEMILRQSFNIYPALYENTIEKIPGVTCACLIGVYDEEIEDEKVILVIEPDLGIKLNRDSLLKNLKSGKFSIDRQALPDEIIFRKIPRSGRQKKIDRNSLRMELRP